ncbi:TOMM propeptide domain-containing protein [Flavobacterium hungaricum]|uniref:TOMM propeptide domain-containing protein n=1 Tax=Flavobacterium hungaricum TaxID=2082725 RepID=A0ABR9TM38_9FLAO|nr:TOMM propeptide domain-containing protein [Flavobacterium hungaricum]MBE8726437.1 TOMM propeptide domain-containing protein [Flavobacterium hungaricum]
MELTNDQKILDTIVKKAWKDPTFKNDLITRPVATIESLLGRPIHLPEGKNIAFVDQTDSSTIFINIPAEIDMDDLELNEEQLDTVSGGDGDVTPPIIIKPTNSSGSIF